MSSIRFSGLKCPYCGEKETFVIKKEVIDGKESVHYYSFAGYAVICENEECGKFICFLREDEVEDTIPKQF